ncbi:beta-galactosidase [Mycolicibacterium arenosum]|uniref:Cellulase family glycosylhydrolase n=1 Tax=Mycolicibacterium arenosum TaxID=2952157 RepID=A0ABT1M5U4_9MYCO|nr:beta-galactosidase [Mycolicibacterium sp. CAU 1645]MCP9273812.1 cellulase family glycosylhydrolase [Mycolicibacterium sp. CAU 1645]
MRRVRRRAVVLALGIATLLSGCAANAEAPGPPLTIQPAGVRVAPPIEEVPTTIGMADSDLYAQPAPAVDRAFQTMRDLGVTSVRLMVPWAGVQPAKGVYDWQLIDRMVDGAARHGLSVLATLNATPSWAVTPGTPILSGRPRSPAEYGEFAAAAADRYRGRITAYEIWNEQNAVTFYTPRPDAAGYVALLKAAYPAIKAADPHAVVVTGGLGALVDHTTLTIDAVKFVKGMYAAGAKGYFDGIGYHPYQYTTMFSEGGYHPDSPINQVAGIRAAMLANGDEAKKIWITEYGLPSSEGGDKLQARYVDDMLTAWRRITYAGPVYLYTMRDRRTGSPRDEDTLGAYRSDGSAKPVVDVILSHTRTGN